MIKLVNHYLQYKSRPEKFRRDYKFSEQEIKDTNPKLLASSGIMP